MACNIQKNLCESVKLENSKTQYRKWRRMEGLKNLVNENQIFKSSHCLGSGCHPELISGICRRPSIGTALLTVIGVLLSTYLVVAFQPIVHKALDENMIYGIRVARRMGTTT